VGNPTLSLWCSATGKTSDRQKKISSPLPSIASPLQKALLAVNKMLSKVISGVRLAWLASNAELSGMRFCQEKIRCEGGLLPFCTVIHRISTRCSACLRVWIPYIGGGEQKTISSEVKGPNTAATVLGLHHQTR